MKFFLGKSSQSALIDRSRLNKDFYEFNKTVLHGFPSNPTCLAYDDQYNLLAIGTKNGSIQIYGKPGVEFHYEFEDLVEVNKILFVPKKGQIVCLGSDQSLHLLQITSHRDQFGIRRLHSNNAFVSEDDSSTDKITVISLSTDGKKLFIGTKDGHISLLNTEKFTLDSNSIKQETILASIDTERKFNPGSVEAIEEQPEHNGNLLIGYSRSLVVLWDYINQTLVNHFRIDQSLESLSWNKDGINFITSHNDGSYNIWNAEQESHSSSGTSKLPYGPYPCKAITKILWDKTSNGEFFFFSGGMPRAAYGDKEVVSIIFQNFENVNQEKNHVLDFTSKVVDFLLIHNDANEPRALIILVEEEIVAIDLTHPEWLQYKLPYLSCLHSSSITCSQHYSNVKESLFKLISEAGQYETSIKHTSSEWPIKGGISKYQCANESYDLLITGHEDGTVRFWDASSTSLKHLYTLSTSKIFNSNEDDIALIDDDVDLNEEENEWPPFRKVGHFDPYSDDPRLAIRKICFCPNRGVLAIGGTAGQLIVFELQDKPSEYDITKCELKIIDDKDGFVWKGHGPLSVRTGQHKFEIGYQPSSLLQIHPPAAITAVIISTQWQVVGVGTAQGFGLYDYVLKSVLVRRTTLKQINLSAVSGADALISRRKSFKKSLRESFRRLRKGRSQKSKRDPANQAKLKEIKGIKFDSDLEAKPVERQIEARTEDLMSSMVKYLYFCSAVIISNTMYPTFWIGTNAGTVFIYVLASDKNNPNQSTWQLAKEFQLKHKAPIAFIRLIDHQGAPIFENNQIEHDKHSPTRILICSEEQFKMFTLPNFKTLLKFKLTAHEGARVRRLDLGYFTSKTNENQSEYSLMCLTNQGDVRIYSLHDFKLKYQSTFTKKEDINGITSLVFTKYGEGFFLKSSSEYQRFSLSLKRANFPECFIQIIEDEPELKQTEAVEAATESADDTTKEDLHETSDESTIKDETLNKTLVQCEDCEEQPEGESEALTESEIDQILSETTESIINHVVSSTITEEKSKNGTPSLAHLKVN